MEPSFTSMTGAPFTSMRRISPGVISSSRMPREVTAAVPVRMLSTGQRKRSALARVLACNAPLWLLDEPANGLDADGLDCLAGIISAARAAGRAMLVASHQPIGLGDHRTIKLT